MYQDISILVQIITNRENKNKKIQNGKIENAAGSVWINPVHRFICFKISK
jgi:hypothetical protein